jgi:hypothetical protein
MKTAPQLVKDYLYRKDIKPATLARKLGTSPQNLWKKLERQTLETGFLTEICEALEYNFFFELGNEWAAAHNLQTVTTETPRPVVTEAQIRNIIRQEMLASKAPAGGDKKKRPAKKKAKPK